MPHAASPGALLLPLLVLPLLALSGAAAVADIAEVPSLGGGQEQHRHEFISQQGSGLEGELRELKSYAATKHPPASESSGQSAFQEPYTAPSLTTHKDVTPEQSTEVGYIIADAWKSPKTATTENDDQQEPPPVNQDIGSSNMMSATEEMIKGERLANTEKSKVLVESASVSDRMNADGVASITDQQECQGRNDKCKTLRSQDANDTYNKISSAADIQKRTLLSHHKDGDISVPESELSRSSTGEGDGGMSYEVANDRRELKETSEEGSDNDGGNGAVIGASEEQEDDDEEEDDEDYDGEGNGESLDGELEIPNDETLEENDAEELADNAEFNKVAEDLLELMVHIAENPTRWQRLASNLKEDAGRTDGYRSLSKRRSLERLKHRHQQREFDWSTLKEYRETPARHLSDTKERKNRLRQLMKAGVLPEDDHILRPLGKSRSGKGGNGIRNRNKHRQRGRGRGRPSRRKLSRKGLVSHGIRNSTVSNETTALVTAAPPGAEVTNTTRKTVHPMDDEEFLAYARQVASRYQTALTDDVIREKVMQGWKGTPAPQKETPPYSGKKLPQYDPEAVVSRYKYVLTDEAIREKIMQGPRGRSDERRERLRPPLPPPRNITVPPYRDPSYIPKPQWSGWNNSSQQKVSAEQVSAGRNDSGVYNVSTRGGAQYSKEGRSPWLGAYHSGIQLKNGRYSTGEEMWQEFVDRALNNTSEDRGWEKEQGVQPKQAVAGGGGGGGVEDNNLPVGPAPQPTPRRLPHFTYHRVTSQPAPRSRHRDAYVAVSVAAPPDGHRQRHKGAAAGAAAPSLGAEQGAARAAVTAPTPTVAVSPPATTAAPIDMEAIRRVLHMRDPLEEELVEAAVAARQLTRWPASGDGGGGGGSGGGASGDPQRRHDFWQHLGDVLKLQEETKTLAALEAKLHSAREADQDRVRKILGRDVTAEEGAVRGM